MYQGENYDAAPLIDAKKLVKQLKSQFAGELSPEERQRLADVEAQLNLKFAERDYRMAKFYDDTKHYSSAKFYYAQLLRKYPGTPLAEEAHERYLALADEPDHPQSRVQWFIDMFPENAERQSIAQVPMIESADQTRLAAEPQDVAADGDSIYR